jgi:hypothetical protein
LILLRLKLTCQFFIGRLETCTSFPFSSVDGLIEVFKGEPGDERSGLGVEVVHDWTAPEVDY